ncbi:PAS domain-containing sensor histidine kinase [Flammeovirga aprica]|uniref:histidine kinase n=1 Tax=Flammeovirga aprica JL-4 TaxID=694437 RepID=A0A7X9RS62_9BACT|nr:ATP-binding protein [Flammeovirga aprica]NME66646.1 PAS domain-containing protein [Flammeovirga aprica JL-4]
MDLHEIEKTNLRDPYNSHEVLYHESPEMFMSICPKTAKLITCNSTLCQTLGYNEKEIIGKSIFELYDTACHDKVKVLFSRFKNDDAVENEELCVRRKDGVVFPVLLSAKAVKNNKGEIMFSNSCWRDITKIKELESSLMKSNQLLNQKVKELAQKNKELEQFAYIVSHDLNTPLRNIKGVLQLIDEDSEGEIPLAWNTYFGYINQSVGRMERLIDTILEFSQLGIKSEKERIRPQEILKNVLEDFALEIQNQDVVIRKGTLPEINGYAVEFHMLLQNLIGNAIKFQDSSRTPEIEVGAIVQKEDWMFYVKDNGIGINMEHRHKIFSFFKRVNEKFQGTGIGLAQCKKIVELHGGRIWVERNETKGSCFYFTIPK